MLGKTIQLKTVLNNELSLKLVYVLPMDGFPLLRSILQDGMKPNAPTVPESIPAFDFTSDTLAVGKLKTDIERFQNFSGTFKPSPLFGEMDKPTLRRLHL